MCAAAGYVLLVDDDPDFLVINRMVLERAGYRVLCASGPQDAWQQLEQAAPAVVVTDLMMGHFDSGFSFAQQLKADPRFTHVPIIVATAVTSATGLSFRPRTAQELGAMHADAYFDKPVEPKALVAKVAELVGRSPSKAT